PRQACHDRWVWCSSVAQRPGGSLCQACTDLHPRPHTRRCGSLRRINSTFTTLGRVVSRSPCEGKTRTREVPGACGTPGADVRRRTGELAAEGKEALAMWNTWG